MEELTYQDWLARGRTVRKGEHAAAYLVKPDLTEAYPLFSEAQTEAARGPSPDWIRQTVDEWQRIRRARKSPQRLPTAHVLVIEANDAPELEVWVGNNKGMVKQLREWGFKYVPTRRRWASTSRTDIEVVLERFRTTDKLNVIWD